MMKKYSFLILALCLSFAGMAQISSGYIKMELIDIQTEDPQMAQSIGSMKGATNEIYFSPEMQRTDINMMGGFVNLKVYTDLKTQKITMFNEIMGKKTKIVTTEEEQKKLSKKEAPSDIKVVYDKNDTKTIAGYLCHKATITMTADGQPLVTTMYVTDKIKMNKSNIPNMSEVNIEGAPLELTVDMGMMKMTYTTKEFKETAPKDAFAFPAGDYEELSMEDYMNQMGGMGGF